MRCLAEEKNLLCILRQQNKITQQKHKSTLHCKVLFVCKNSKTHEFVDLIAKIGADKGVTFDFANNEKLKASGFALEGVTVNGYKSGAGITINIESNKALNSVVGHEITHVLEGTELYTELQNAVIEYAKTKGEYQSRLDSITELYKNIKDADINAELTADLVGDYLFTDADFLRNLSAKHRNVFQKLFDEIKYLCKVATAGSKEARELEKVKKSFEEAFRAETKNTVQEDGVKYSITEAFTDDNGTHFENAVLLDTNFFDGLSPRNWGEKLRKKVEERASNDPFILPIVDESGNTTILQFANPHDRVTKDGKSGHKVIDKLSISSDNISKLAVIHIDEIVSVSEESFPYFTTENNHQWLDKNGWLHRNANVINQKNGSIYNLTFDIAKAADGRTILYATDGKIKKVGSVQVNSLKIKGSGQDSNSKDIVPRTGKNVNNNFSLSNEGEQRKLGGSYRFDGKDFGVTAEEDIGPVREMFDEDIGPVAETANSQTSVDSNTQLPMDDIGPVRETFDEDIGPVKDGVGSDTKGMYVDAKRKEPLI